MRTLRPSRSLWPLVLFAIAGCGGGVHLHDYSTRISTQIEAEGIGRIQRVTNGVGGPGSAVIDNVRCVQNARTETYSCLVRYSYRNSEGTYKYEVRVSASCEAGGSCRWRPDGGGALVGAEPD